MLILIHSWPYTFALKPWIERTNSDLKRMVEQQGVKLLRSEHGAYGLNNPTAVKPIAITLSTKMKDLEYGDIILFGGRKDLNRVILEVMNEDPPVDPEITFFRWLLDNRQDLYDCHYDLGIYAQNP